MRRALAAAGTIAALVVLLPGAALIVGLVAAWRYVFRREDTLTDETVRRIRSDAERSARLRETEEIPRGRRTVLDGPSHTSALSKPWGSRP